MQAPEGRESRPGRTPAALAPTDAPLRAPSGGVLRPRRRRLKSLSVLPTLFTLGNLLCGFAAIYFALHAMLDLGAGTASTDVVTLKRAWIERFLPTWLSIGAFMIVLGMICDGLDGLAARVTRSTTDFGGQLDSLADVVTCGVAPAMLMIAYMMAELRGVTLVSPISADFWGKLAWISAALYAAFAALRLARYNVEHDREDFDYRTFRGLPSPGAAAMMVTFLFLHDQLPPEWRGWIVYAIPVFLLGTGCLMVSRIPYRRVQAYFKGRRPFGHVVAYLLLAGLLFTYKAAFLFLIGVIYVLSGPVIWTVRRQRMKHARAAEPPTVVT
ncbi:MAG: CDP-alcohol phosphatidyltransferase family protein [Phycisphaerae bacterium]|nr:MAG: hypothetical protein F9K17_09125 [Phycisphaerae bacterium]MBE7456230.1 CDP-alcohol phosphatidyltransferase family protein [Planctomycetia bacterium]MCQ3921065.1 hypothetical protein [Planctomycetota bacterium]MCK6464779.1 CDP-alcohol phosphatidyltransferase family protein [Phycisphaerae bacterium]MCL4719879.1 CDP-alcohol phosphatidyltransferase family protein [Phycisphaerae bacterium]